MGWLDGETVLITGGGSGLGLAVARRCLAEGAQVCVMERAASKVERLRYEHPEILALVGDATSLNDHYDCRAAIEKRFGRLSALIGMQGIWDGNIRLNDITPDRLTAAFDEIFAVNVRSYLLSVRIFSDMLAASRGSITLTLSNAAFSADGGGVLYTASKHAVTGIVRQLAFELAPHIRVNGIAPNAIRGSDLRGAQALGLDGQSQADRPAAAFEDHVRRLVPLERLPDADDYTSLYVTLAAARHGSVMTGAVISADQGMAVRGLYPRPASSSDGSFE